MNRKKHLFYIFLLLPSFIFSLEIFNIKSLQGYNTENIDSVCESNEDMGHNKTEVSTCVFDPNILSLNNFHQTTENELELEGTWSYSYSLYDNYVTIEGDRIINNRSGGHSGSLQLILYLTSTKYYGGSIYGYELGIASFDTLEGGAYYYDIDKYLNINSIPRNGTYYVTLVLLEYSGYQYEIVDYINFDGTTSIY